jgi:hypothetical protein
MATLARDAGQRALSQYIDEDAQLYRELFAPEMMELRRIGLGMGAGNAYQAATSALGTAGRSFDSAISSFTRDRLRAGLATDDASAASQQRRLSLQRIIQQVDAANRASRGAMDARRMAQTWGLQSFGDAASAGTGILRQIAQNEADREAQYQIAKAQAKQAGLRALTTMAGIGIGAWLGAS